MRLHGPKRWYRHDYSDQELGDGPTGSARAAQNVFVYFNNDYANAPRNAQTVRCMLSEGRTKTRIARK